MHKVSSNRHINPTTSSCVVLCVIILFIIGVQLILNITIKLNEFNHIFPHQSNQEIPQNNINRKTSPDVPQIQTAAYKQSNSASSTNKPRVVMSLTAVPDEIPDMVNETINNLLNKQTYVVDIIYLNIPYIQLRNNNKLYPSTSELYKYFPQSKVYINRILGDVGPTTRYLGGIKFENDPETLILTMDHDTWNFHEFTISQLVEYSQFDPNSVWTIWGENIIWNPSTNYWGVNYWRYPMIINKKYQKAWNKVEVLRAVNGVVFKRKWFDDFWYNSTDYSIGCFWTDDHWFSFNMERKGIDIKLVHDYKQALNDMQNGVIKYNEQTENKRIQHKRRLGTLTEVNKELKSEPTCTIAIMQKHPNIWVNARDSNATQK